MKQRLITVLALALSLSAVGPARADDDRGGDRGAVYTMSNAAAGNAVLMFDRLGDGRLVAAGCVASGGSGTGGGLGNQGGLVLSEDDRWLLAVNAGSHSLSVFEVRARGLRLVDVAPTGGTRPISVTEHDGVVYVVHAGSDDIAGFTLSARGQLRPLADSVHGLSGAGVGPAQIAFTPAGDFLLVTEKATNRITTFAVDRRGRPTDRRVQDAAGVTPFGFAFGRRGQVVVTEAFGGAPDGSATSSYRVGRDGTLTVISASAATHQTAACWAAVTPNGRFAYAANAGSGSITGYAVARDGQLSLLDEDGRTGVTGAGSAPVDLALAGGRFLYNLNNGSHAIAAFVVGRDGSLTPLPFATGLPVGANGLAAR